ncbi:ubiquitin-specific protease [Thraustotheca clavata]|uniref:Ubiquitin carboxyl-terminal hydrolase n=1 Tax=Thraustotheca clavata TaxID=74557 RepID=A0A1V9YX79_9STRA|nr:ubiquitin-specific protease [Thraustotheca clavata]
MMLATGTTVQLKTAEMLVKERRIEFRQARKASNAGSTAVALAGQKVVKKPAKTTLIEMSEIHGLVKWKAPRKIGPGLSNLGNTCYLNSVLQCLAYSPPLAQYLIARANTNKSTNLKAGFAAEKAMARFLAEMHSKNVHKVVRPSEIVSNLRQISKFFRIGRQEDSHEFFRHFLDSMHKMALKNAGLKDDNSPKSLSTLVHSVFGGTLRSYVKCAKCKFVSERIEPYLDLSLEISSGISTIENALRHFTAVEKLDAENAWMCSGCSQRSRASKGLSIQTVPNALVLHLKRFDVFHGKLKKHITFEETLDLNLGGTVLSPTCPDKKYTKYKLTGVLVHSGMSSDCGHYYAFVKSPAGLWYEMNDECVSMVQLQTVLKQRAYMLFYIRESVPAPPITETKAEPKTLVPEIKPVEKPAIETFPVKFDPNEDDTTSEESLTSEEEEQEEEVKGRSIKPVPVEIPSTTPSKSYSFAPAFGGPINRIFRFGLPWKQFSSNNIIIKQENKEENTKQTETSLSVKPVAINPKTLNKNSLFGAEVAQWNDDADDTSKDAASIALQTEHNKKVRLMNQNIWQHKKKVALDTWDQTLDLGKLKKVKKRKEFASNEGAANQFQKALDTKKFKIKMAFRGRGRGRGGFGGGFGGRGGISVADIVGGTMEELGISHTQMQMLNGENTPLYPPIKLPAPAQLNESDKYLVHKMRIIADRMVNLYPTAHQKSDVIDDAEIVHVTAPEMAMEDPLVCFVPREINENISHELLIPNDGRPTILRPRAFEKTLKSLEQKEGKAKPDIVGEEEEVDEDEDMGDEEIDDYQHDYYGSDDNESDGGYEEVY